MQSDTQDQKPWAVVIGHGPEAEARRAELEQQGFRATRTHQDLWEAADQQDQER
jgi:hypothetical protein